MCSCKYKNAFRCSSRLPKGWGVCLPRGVSAWGVSAQGGVYPGCIPACTEADPQSERNDWQTGVKTLPCRNFVTDGKTCFKCDINCWGFLWTLVNLKKLIVRVCKKYHPVESGNSFEATAPKGLTIELGTVAYLGSLTLKINLFAAIDRLPSTDMKQIFIDLDLRQIYTWNIMLFVWIEIDMNLNLATAWIKVNHMKPIVVCCARQYIVLRGVFCNFWRTLLYT